MARKNPVIYSKSCHLRMKIEEYRIVLQKQADYKKIRGIGQWSIEDTIRKIIRDAKDCDEQIVMLVASRKS